MIELARENKRGLALAGPIILHGGYGSDWDSRVLARANAVATRPLSFRARPPDRDAPRVHEFAGGAVVRSEGVNPGLGAILRAEHQAWRALAIPLLLTLSQFDARHWPHIAARVNRLPAVAGLVLECPTLEHPAAIADAAMRSDLPLISKLPLEGTLEIAELSLESGAHALVVGLPPRGIAPASPPWEGDLIGPAVMPLMLRALREAVERFPETPVIASGGVHTSADIEACLALGACAVELDTAVWRGVWPPSPDTLTSIAGEAESS